MFIFFEILIYLKWLRNNRIYKKAGCSGRMAVIRRRYSASRKKSDWNELCRIVDIPDDVSSIKRNFIKSSCGSNGRSRSSLSRKSRTSSHVTCKSP